MIALPPLIDDAPTVFDGGGFPHAGDLEESTQTEATNAAVSSDAKQGLNSKNSSQSAAALQEPQLEPAASEIASPSLPASWLSTSKSRREVPKAAKLGGLGVLLLLLLVFVVPKTCGSQSQTTHSSMIAEDGVEDAEHLKKRRHLTDADFRTRGKTPAVEVAPELDTIDLEERKRQRDVNPEDIRSARKRRPGGARSRSLRKQSMPREPEEEKSPFIFFNQTPQSSSASQHVSAGKRTLLSAASTVAVSLSNDVVIRRGRTTVIATVGRQQALPAGTRLIGQASASFDGIVSIRFDTLALPSGATAKARAEALDASTGSPDLLGSMLGGVSAKPTRPGVARSVGVSAADRLASGVFGSGIVGGAARQTLAEGNRSRSVTQRSARTVTLSRETKLQALFLLDVTVNDGG